MSLFALICALLLEQLAPLYQRHVLYDWLTGYVDFFQQHFNSGEYSHGKTAWWLAVGPMLAGGALLFWGLNELHPVLAWMFNVFVLYLCMGFGKYSHRFTDIQLALRSGRLDEARELLFILSGKDAHDLNAEEIARISIETTLIAALQHFFGVIVWYIVFSLLGLGGAAGALFYCLILALGIRWEGEFNAIEPGMAQFNCFAREMSARMSWLPVRLTAATFAIVGNFEDTVYCWRSQAANWPDPEIGILLAGAAGASGVRLGMPVLHGGVVVDRPELGVGDKVNDNAMHCAKRLLWRAALFMIVTLFMLTLAGLLR